MYNDLKHSGHDADHDPEDARACCTRPDVLEAAVGAFGRWQLVVCACMALLKLPVAWFQLGIVFLAPPTDFWCRAPIDYQLYTRDRWLALIRPANASSFRGNSARCVMRNIELPSNLEALQPCKWGMEYDRTIFETNIISEWNLVCGREHFVDLTQSILMLGILIGSALFGALADKHGRRVILMTCITLQAVCGLASAWPPWIGAFLTLRFFMALANGGTMIVSFVLCMEVVGGRWRRVVPILYQIPFGLGSTAMALVAYSFRTWREFQIALSLLSGVFTVYYWIIPESPRWLLAVDRRKEACEVLERAAEINGLDATRVRSGVLATRRSRRPDVGAGFASLVRTPAMRRRTLALVASWFASGLTLYGFTQYLGHLGANVYFNVSVGGLITVPGTLLGVAVVGRCGRRRTVLITNLFVAACFLAILAVPDRTFDNDWPKVLFAALGVVGLSVATPTLYLFTGELYPTMVRNVGLGACVTCSRIGSMLSPFVVSLGRTAPFLPLVVLAAGAGLQSVLVLPLPDSGNALAETVGDVEACQADTRRKPTHDDADENPFITVN